MKCRICGNENDNKEISVLEMMIGTRDSFKYFQCSSCGCLQISEIPENIASYYPSNYYSLANQSSSFLENEKTRFAVRNKSGLIGRLLYSYKPDQSLRALSQVRLTNKSSILDVGCGSGHLLRCLKNIGFSNLAGVDPFIKEDIDYPGSLNIRKMSIFELNPRWKWDLIILSHSLEHMWEQKPTMEMISRLLHPNGVCVIRIPLADSWAYEYYGVNWCAIDAPRHYYIHTVKSLELLAQKAGLKVRNYTYDSYELQFIGSEKYKKGQTLDSITTNSRLTKLLNYPKKFYYRYKASQLNKNNAGDQAAFYLVKV